jgi:hypothetical protein
MNADYKAHWLKPSPPLAVDGVPAGSDGSEASPSLAPSDAPEIRRSDQEAQVAPRPRRVDAVRVYDPRADA